ncbi:MAG: acyl-CoA thioesterase [Beijerinckiaceae bacterium]
MARPTPARRSDYVYFDTLQTRWADNDVYGHMNNVVHYALFDTVIGGFLMSAGLLRLAGGETIGVVVETGCNYFAEMAYPDKVAAGVRIAHVGTSSVRYEIGLFRNEEDTASAQGHFVHVYVDRQTRRPKPLTQDWRDVFAGYRTRA